MSAVNLIAICCSPSWAWLGLGSGGWRLDLHLCLSLSTQLLILLESREAANPAVWEAGALWEKMSQEVAMELQGSERASPPTTFHVKASHSVSFYVREQL